MKLTILSSIALFVFLSACSEHDVAFPENEFENCDYNQQPFKWDETSPNDLIPEDLLTFSEVQAKEVSAKTIADPEEKQISLDITRRGNNAFYMASNSCESYLEIPLSISFRTTHENTFDETMDVTARELNGGLVIDHVFNLNDLSGSFAPTPPQNAKIHALSLNMAITPTTGDGKILVHTEQKNKDGSLTDTTEQHWSWSWLPAL